MNEFDVRQVFFLDEGFGKQLKISMTFSNETRELLDVTFSDPDRNQMVSVPFDLWKRVVESVERNTEY